MQKIKKIYCPVLIFIAFALGFSIPPGQANQDVGTGESGRVRSGSTDASRSGHGHAFNFGEPAKPGEVTRTIQVTLKDNSFKPAEVQVRPGESIRFVLTNEGKLLHEFNIGTPTMHRQHQTKMMEMMERGILTPTGVRSNRGQGMNHEDPNSLLVEPGKTKELLWSFKHKKNLQFACNIPGHYESGMVGEFEFLQ